MKRILMAALLLLTFAAPRGAFAAKTGYGTAPSVYKMRPADEGEARYFIADNSGKTDVSDALQSAINDLKKELNWGTLFIPEGKYLISKTIYIPTAIRVIGYGEHRPEFVLKDNAPGFDQPAAPVSGAFSFTSLVDCKYMFYFTGSMVEDPNGRISDANAGTFYSGMANVNIRIGKGNPYATALRTHYAQHSMVSHIDIQIGEGFAGIVDVGNELADLRFFGGKYGIHTMMCSPSWPMMLLDSYFEGQKVACVHSYVGGLTFVNCAFRNSPRAYEMHEGAYDRLYVEKCSFENIKEAAFVIAREALSTNQINILECRCSNVPTFVKNTVTGKTYAGAGKTYDVHTYTFGLASASLEDPGSFIDTYDAEPATSFAAFKPVLPEIPDMSTWINVKDFGARGDGINDDTDAIYAAMEKGDNIFFPAGVYRVTRTVKMGEHTKFFGFHPFATQLAAAEGTPAFSGFGTPAPILETSEGGDNMLYSIGINSGANNYRIVGVKWTAGADSYLYDVKFIGGHGTMWRGERPAGLVMLMGQASGVSTPSNPIYTYGKDLAWDSQYWSLWVTDGGGGTFRSIWTANSYAGNGIFVNNTSTPSNIYAISIEHHCRNEVRFDNVHNWNIYDIQTEEEGKEGTECLAVELNECSNLKFANLFMMRVYRVTGPMVFSVRTWDCRDIEFYNIHNYGQNRYTANSALYDVNTRRNAASWEMARLTITGKESKLIADRKTGKFTELSTGYEFAENTAVDSKGNVYFSEALRKSIYKYSPDTGKTTILFECTYEPVGLVVDSDDNLVVIFNYAPQSVIDGAPEKAVGPNSGIFGGNGVSRMVFAINPENPYGSIQVLPRVDVSSVKNPEAVWYPSSRAMWTSFETNIAKAPSQYFAAPDGKTFIADISELARCSSLSKAVPGGHSFTVDEQNRRFFKVDVKADGTFENAAMVAPRGEFGWAEDKAGNTYVADGNIYIYDKSGVQTGVIEAPERLTSIVFADGSCRKLYATSRNAFYRIDL